MAAPTALTERRAGTVPKAWARFVNSGSRLSVSVVVAFTTLLLLWSRLANLGTSLWNDEAATALTYAGVGPKAIFSGHQYSPNNHVLFSLLTWATTSAVGRFEAAFRLWSVFPGLIAVALVAWWIRRWFGTVAAVLVLVFATMSPVHLVLTPQARGYGLAMLSGAVMLIGATRASRLGRRDGLVLFAAGGFVGIATLPVFILSFVCQAAVLLARRELRRMVIVSCAVVALLSAIFYAPLVRGILHSSHQKVGVRLSFAGFVTGPYRDLGKPTVGALLPKGGSSIAAFVVLGVLVTLGLMQLLRQDRVFCLHLIVPVLGTYLALELGRFYVEPRFASFLFFHVVVLLAVGGSFLWNTVAKWRLPRLFSMAAALLAFVLGSQHVIAETRQQAEKPWENFKMVGEIVKATSIDRVYTNSVAAGLEYYVRTEHLGVLSPRVLRNRAYCFLPGPFAFVSRQGRGAVQPDLACLGRRGGVEMQVPQQINPPVGGRGAIIVWLVPRASSAPQP